MVRSPPTRATNHKVLHREKKNSEIFLFLALKHLMICRPVRGGTNHKVLLWGVLGAPFFVGIAPRIGIIRCFSCVVVLLEGYPEEITK